MEIVLLWILCFISYLWHLVKWLGTIENKASKLAVLHVSKTSSGVLGGRVNVLQVCVLAGRQISYIFIYIFILTHNGCSQIMSVPALQTTHHFASFPAGRHLYVCVDHFPWSLRPQLFNTVVSANAKFCYDDTLSK